MSAEHEQLAASGMSRRQLITRGAIAGGLVWAAPVIRTTAAYATTANGTERPCTDFFMVVMDERGNHHNKPPNLNNPHVPPAIRQWFLDNPDVPVQFPAPENRPLLTQTSNDAWAILMPEVSGPNAAGRQCRMVLGWAEKHKSFSEGYIDPNPPLALEVGRRLLFPCPEPRRADDDDRRAGGATTSGDPLSASDTAEALIGSDGTSSGGTISSDGDPSLPITSDGSPSTNTPKPSKGCIDSVFLIYCCPR